MVDDLQFAKQVAKHLRVPLEVVRIDSSDMAADLEQLLLVGENGIGAVKGAKWIVPPAKGEAALQVGDDYPYKASFNIPWSQTKKK